jgi:integrase
VARSVADGTHAPPSKLTVNELFETDLDTQTKLGRMKSSTAYTYRRLFDRYVKPRLGAVRAQDLRASDLDALYGDLLTGGRRHATIRRGAGLSAGTVTTVHAVLSGMFSRGVKPGDVAVNPCRRASPPAAQTSETPV